MEDFFWELENRRSCSLRRPKYSFGRGRGRRQSKEIKNLHSDVNYETKKRGGKGKSRGRRDKSIVSVIEEDYFILEHWGAWEL